MPVPTGEYSEKQREVSKEQNPLQESESGRGKVTNQGPRPKAHNDLKDEKGKEGYTP